MPVDWSTLHKVLRDETRKKIILTLQKADPLTYTDLMNRLEITNTGKLNYHLKTLNDLVAKNDQGEYMLTERGKAAAELLEKFPNQIVGSKALRGFDAAIIGLIGLLLTGIPTFFEFFLLTGTTSIPPVLFSLYLLLIPSFVMWWLTTRRTSSHDLYELVKPPLIALGVLYLLIILVFFVPNILATTAPPPSTNTTTTAQSFILAGFISLFLFPSIPLLGVLLIEGIYRFRKR